MDASYKIQRGIHVHLIQFFMCPEFWVHISLALRTTDNAGAARLLGENRVPCTLEDGWLTLPLLSDADAASLSRFLASHRVDLLRMEERQKSLEDLFLELTGREESL